jgi:hypothetical protein
MTGGYEMLDLVGRYSPRCYDHVLRLPAFMQRDEDT